MSVALMVIGVALLLPLMASAAEPPGENQPTNEERPVIGLVLSGGSAAGLAHVGVIRWLEEHRIPIDMIAGSSIGGLVAGIYATGADAQEMAALMDTLDWQVLLSGETPYPLKAFRRKEDRRATSVPLEIGLRDGVRLPTGLDAGHQVGLFVDRVAFPYSHVASFSDLPTPFATVAVDLASGQQVVFRSGSLAEALRSTMAFPGWFQPVISGDRVLVDGGVLNNLPTDVMLEMGAEIVIAVDVGMRTAERETFDTLMGVANRTISVMMRENTDRSAELADILITPDAAAFAMDDFGRVDELQRIGYDAAAELADELGAHSVDEETWDAHVRARDDRRRALVATPQFLDLSGAAEVDEAAVAAALDGHLGVPLDVDGLEHDLTEITGWGRYAVAGYESRQRAEVEGLGIGLQQKTHGPPFLRPILEVGGEEFREARVTFGGRLIFFDIAGTNSEWRVDATYGQTSQVATDLFVPLGTTGFFMAPRALAGRETQFAYDLGEKVAEYDVDRIGGGGDIGYLFGPRSELRLGVTVEHQSAAINIGDPLLPKLEGTTGYVGARWTFDGSNRALVATSGARLELRGRWVFASPNSFDEASSEGATYDDRFYQARLQISAARPLTRRFFLVTGLAGGSSFGATASPLEQFQLGGPLRLGALGVGERRGSNFYFGRVGLLWGFASEEKPSLLGRFYLTASYEIGDAFDRKSELYQDITFGLVGDTLLGGVFVGGAVGQDGNGSFFFALGPTF